MEYSKIIIPSSLHPDTIVAIFFLKKFGAAKYPGIEKARIEILQQLPAGENGDLLLKKGVIVLDVGGGTLDHHAKGRILSELVAEDLGIESDGGLAKLLAYTKRDDQYGIGTISTDQLDRAFGLSGLISAINKTVRVPEKVIEVLYPLLDAHYTEERKRTSELPKEFEESMREGKAEVFEARHKGKKLIIVILESDNISMAGWLKSSIGIKADVVCQQMSSGYTNILTKQIKRIDLRQMAVRLRTEELKLKGNQQLPSPSRLMTEGKLPEVPEWYYDKATNSLLNGGVNPKGISATQIPLETITEIIKESLAKDGSGKEPRQESRQDSHSKMKTLYTAEFVKNPAVLLEKFPPKHPRVFAHHSTIVFKPSSLEGIEMGKESTLKIVARVYDEKGDALLVENPKSNSKHPHITLSCAQGISPAYSNELMEKAMASNLVEYFEKPEEVEVIEGYFDGQQDITK
ncbi:hypothetical protein KW786_01575 [Candidatus Parcubacteria bacterium]|nr:hypothetical protein [Candidatus Parcubacteria bacterium]